MPQKLLAEFIGTFTVVLITLGSICADQYLRAASLTHLGILAEATAYGIATAVMMAALEQVSGAHLNPAITVGFWVTRRMGTPQAVLYCVVQLVGAIVAAYILAMLLPESIWRPVALGATDLATDFTRMQAMLLEGVGTFFVVFVFFACAQQPSESTSPYGAPYAGIGVGLTIAAVVLFLQPFTGASMNPARSFGPALVAHHWVNHGVYWVGPLFGGVIGAFVYDRVFGVERGP
ncbi:MAG TPA: aquaporin [Candidatus Acidoferrales bacterium]|nr:aquaporin [Candidatus Acidoferrales bacterium]